MVVLLSGYIKSGKNRMLYFLIFLLICETLYIVVLSSDIKRLERINKELNNEKQKISDKYEAGLFESKNCKKELEELQDVEKARYKEVAEKFLTDTGYYMKRVFELSKENKELRNKIERLKNEKNI